MGCPAPRPAGPGPSEAARPRDPPLRVEVTPLEQMRVYVYV